jgi:hypothetical protein
MNNFHKPFLLAASLSCAALAAQAQVNNGNFSQGLTGWNPQGDAVAVAGVMTLTNASLLDAADAPFNRSGNNPQDNVGALEAAAGVSPYGLDLSADDYATEGTLAWQIITLGAGDTLSFNYSFSTQEGPLPPSQKDRAFVVLGGQVITLATAVNPPIGLYGFFYQAPAAATLRLAFGVVDTTDFIGASSLSISNVSVAPIPEPASAALLLAGLGLLIGATKLKR